MGDSVDRANASPGSAGRASAERAWAAILAILTVALAVGAVAFPGRVYDRFIWKYFWGPVAADGNDATCAVRQGGSVSFLDAGCSAEPGVVAYPGYTIVSTVSYALLLVLLLAGVYFLAERLDIGTDVGILYALFPWVLFGGALRTLEDTGVVAFPWSAPLISPLIYFTVFFLTLAALLWTYRARELGSVDSLEVPLAAAGTALFLAVTGYLFVLALTTAQLELNLAVLLLVVLGASAITAATWSLAERFAPVVNEGTGAVGLLVIFGHTVDGIANVLSLDWSEALGIGSYEAKHVVNEGVRNVTASIQPAWLTDAIGQTWPFLPLKVAAAVIVVWLFNDEMLEESPRYSILLLLAVIAVGLGPGTRDALRATFGV